MSSLDGSVGTTSTTSTTSPVIYSLPETTIFQSSDRKVIISVPTKYLEESGSTFPVAEPDETQPHLRKPVTLPESGDTVILLLQFVYPTKPDLSHLSIPDVTQLYIASKKYNVAQAMQASTQAILNHPEELLTAALREYSQSSINSNLDLFAHMCVSLPLGNILRTIPADYHCSWIYFHDNWNTLWKSTLDGSRNIHPPDSSCPFAKSLGDYIYNRIKLKPPYAGLWRQNVPFPFVLFATGLTPGMDLPKCCGMGFQLWVQDAEQRVAQLPSFTQVLSMKPAFGTQKLFPVISTPPTTYTVNN